MVAFSVRRRVRNVGARVAEFLPTTAAARQAELLRRIDVVGYNTLGPPSLRNIVSQAVSAEQMLDPALAGWLDRLAETRMFHRKEWEYVVVLEAARQAGILGRGRSAVGFGVGTEPIPAVLADTGLAVLATDQPAATATEWQVRPEHSADVEALQRPAICDPDVLRERVTFRPVDMNDVPDLGTFDLVWSCCAFEHLGSPQAGFDFVHRSLALLRPGGVAVHTTEFDLTPGDQPVDYGHCAAYRREDLDRLCREVRAAGYRMDVNPYVAFEHPADRFIAPEPTDGTEHYHLKRELFASISTSFAVVVHA